MLRYRLDGRLVLDMWREADELLIAKLMGFRRDLADESPSAGKTLEPCSEIVTRTAGMATFTDDNMGSEWRRTFGLN